MRFTLITCILLLGLSPAVQAQEAMGCHLEGEVLSKPFMSSKQIRFSYKITSAKNIARSYGDCAALIGKTRHVQLSFNEMSKEKAAAAKSMAGFLDKGQSLKTLFFQAVFTTREGSRTNEHWEFSDPGIQ